MHGLRKVERLASGTLVNTGSALGAGTLTKNGTHTESTSWLNEIGPDSGSTGPTSSSIGPDVSSASAIPDGWYGRPRNYYSGGNFFPEDPSNRHLGDFGKMLGAQYRTKTYDTVMVWSLPSMETYDSYLGVVAQDLPARPVINGHAAETGGPLWAAERDGAERLRNVEHLRGLAEADVTEALLTKPINEPPTNPWSTSSSLPVWPARLAAANPAYSALNTNVDVIVPPSEMQGFYETLRRHYQSEETAQKLDERDRSLQMPPRTVADANPQLNGWMAQVALTNAKLEINDDTMRRADSGKFDDGGREETKELALAYQTDELIGSAGEDQIVLEAPNGTVKQAFNVRSVQVSNPVGSEFYKGFSEGFFIDGAWGDAEMGWQVLEFGWKTAKRYFNIFDPFDSSKNIREDFRRAKDFVGNLEFKKWGAFALTAAKNGWNITLALKSNRPQDLSQEQIDVLFKVGAILEQVEKIVKETLAQNVSERLKGRIVGMVAYELFTDAALAFATVATEGAAAPATAPAAAAKLAKLVKSLEKFDDAKPLLRALDAGQPLAKKVGDFYLALKILQRTCFVAGTPLLTPEGEKPIEQFQIGDRILAKPENDPHAPVRVQTVEAVFELEGMVLELRVGGQLIETTTEHPFFVAGQGWVRAKDLQPGDPLVGHDERITPLTGLPPV